MTDQADILALVCEALTAGDRSRAEEVLEEHYPFEPVEKTSRRYSERQMTALFVRDGFVDRYRGTRLVFPPTLRLISDALPERFPYHSNWKMSVTHVAYWELSPTVDHVRPAARGGADAESNWACCSMLTNGIKANWTLEQLGWELLPPGDFAEWDGLLRWFVQRVEERHLLPKPAAYYRRWYAAAKPYAV